LLNDEDGYSIHSLFFVLLVLFSVFVLGDVVTTTWLIHSDPAGIFHEVNPFGLSLYSNHGVAGLLLGKMVVFLPFSTIAITAESKYHKIGWFHKTSEVLLLGLIAYSLTIFLNNFLAIINISALKGLPSLFQLLPTMKFLIIILSLTLEGAFLGLSNLRSWMKYAEGIIGTTLIIAPPLLSHRLSILLTKNPLLLIGYVASMLIILGISFFITDGVIRER